MDRAKEIIERLNHLLKGYISEKTIHGKKYFYLQFLENGKLKSRYLRQEEVDATIEELKERERLEEELKEIYSFAKPLATLSPNAKSLTGFIMLEDDAVASFKDGVYEWMDEERAPLVIKRTHDIHSFLAPRAIDVTRTNSRLLKKVLRLSSDSDEEMVLRVNAATITDRYWFKPKGSRTKYEDIRFRDDVFSDLALKGEILFYPKQGRRSPELTLNGSYEKCWKLIDGHWYMYKAGKADEYFSEIVSSRVAKLLGIPSAEYEMDGNYIRTKNFAEEYDYEPMLSIAGDDDSFENVFMAVSRLDKSLAKQYLELIFFDMVINNVDRHNENCGFLRDRKTGRVVSLAPNFDDNLSLISRSRTLSLDPTKDGLIKMFIRFVKGSSEAREYFRERDYPFLNKESILTTMEDLPFDTPNEEVADFILGRYEYLVATLKHM